MARGFPSNVKVRISDRGLEYSTRLHLVMSHAIDLEAAEKFELNVTASSWYDLWHTHLDWEGEGNTSPEVRAKYLGALFVMFERALLQAKNLALPSNIWVLFVPSNSEDDSLYVHTPNPNANSPFPYPFEGVRWGVAPPQELQPFVGERLEVGISEYNGVMYWVRERNAT